MLALPEGGREGGREGGEGCEIRGESGGRLHGSKLELTIISITLGEEGREGEREGGKKGGGSFSHEE